SGASAQGRTTESGGFRAAVLAAAPEERATLLLGFTQRHLASIVGVDPAEITPDTMFAALGMDSLLALDLRTVLERNLQTTLSTTMIFDHPTLEALVSYLNGVLPLSTAQSPQAS